MDSYSDFEELRGDDMVLGMREIKYSLIDGQFVQRFPSPALILPDSEGRLSSRDPRKPSSLPQDEDASSFSYDSPPDERSIVSADVGARLYELKIECGCGLYVTESSMNGAIPLLEWDMHLQDVVDNDDGNILLHIKRMSLIRVQITE